MVSSLLKHATTRWHNIQHLQKIQYCVLGVTDQMFKHIPEFEAMSSEIFFKYISLLVQYSRHFTESVIKWVLRMYPDVLLVMSHNLNKHKIMSKKSCVCIFCYLLFCKWEDGCGGILDHLRMLLMNLIISLGLITWHWVSLLKHATIPENPGC